MQERFNREHGELRPLVERVLETADDLDLRSRPVLQAELRDLHRDLVAHLLPHEKAEADEVYPLVARRLGGDGGTGTMGRTHIEIERLVDALGRLLDGLPLAGPTTGDRRELRRLLYGLHAILRLHFAQEEESFFSVLGVREDDPSVSSRNLHLKAS